jgi:hypothetical protein
MRQAHDVDLDTRSPLSDLLVQLSRCFHSVSDQTVTRISIPITAWHLSTASFLTGPTRARPAVSQYFYSGDYRRAFDQFSMNAGSERWLTVAWNGELYALLVTPMGLKTSAAHVHQITSLTHDYEDEQSIERAYADNIQGGVTGDPRHLLQAVRRLLDQARTLGATLTADTLHIGQQELDVRSARGTWSQDKLEALRILAPPQTKTDMQHALGVFQWFSNTVAGLGNSPQIRPLQAWHRAPRWRQLDDEHRAHFEAAKQMVLTCGTALVLVRYNPLKDLYYVSDASDVGIAGFAFHLSDCGRHIEPHRPDRARVVGGRAQLHGAAQGPRRPAPTAVTIKLVKDPKFKQSQRRKFKKGNTVDSASQHCRSDFRSCLRRRGTFCGASTPR